MDEIQVMDARCEMDGGTLRLSFKVAQDNMMKARRFVTEQPDGQRWLLSFKKYRKKRSYDANAYFWVLCDRLSEATGIDKETIYREAIKDIGGVSETVCVKDEAVKRLRKHWEAKGLGWQTETMSSKLEGCTNVVLYYGSSTYDSKQMAALIDHIIQDCKAVGIETLTPGEQALLINDWGKPSE